jgi:hypothetical protein
MEQEAGTGVNGVMTCRMWIASRTLPGGDAERPMILGESTGRNLTRFTSLRLLPREANTVIMTVKRRRAVGRQVITPYTTKRLPA